MKSPIRRLIMSAAALIVISGSVAAQDAQRSLRIAVSTAADHPLTVGGQKFADLIGSKSGGKIRARLYSGATLGNDVQVIGSLQGGTIDAAIVTAGLVTSLAKEYNMFLLPGVFQNTAQADAVLDGPFGRKAREALDAHRLVALVHLEHGFKHVTNGKRAVTKWEDIQGLKIRVTQTPSLIDTFSRLGANPVPMPFNEVYTALEQGAVDGMETTFATFDSGKFYEVQKHLTMTGHIYDPLVLLVSRATWDKLSADERAVLTASANEAAIYQRKFNRDKEAKMIGELKARGFTVQDISATEKSRMRERLQPVLDKYAQVAGEATAREFFAELDKARAAAK
ncbi:MAG TPA: DctP family TRAP transporter solute-binding subunit [Ramlibacter sp.]|nr:DctP family TRAP transporter solute-binding subunit [Ramlibacter sp.]